MAKGYIVSIHNKIIDEEKLKIYGANAKPALEANGGKYVAKGSNISKHVRNAAREMYHS